MRAAGQAGGMVGGGILRDSAACDLPAFGRRTRGDAVTPAALASTHRDGRPA